MLGLGKNKNKAEETFTPEDLEKLREKYDREDDSGKSRLFGLYSARESANEYKTVRFLKKLAAIILSILVILLLLVFIASFVMTQYGNLVINIDDDAFKKGLTISENIDFKKSTAVLNGGKVENITNITYDWLPEGLDDKDGSHNGDNYLAYTFYVKNNGEEKLDYVSSIEINGAAKSMDEAVRIMVYKNGEPTIYAKPKYKSTEPEPDTTPFENESIVMTDTVEEMKPGDVEKYTIVAWLEGNDPECVDDILGGMIRMTMNFEILDEESGNPQLS